MQRKSRQTSYDGSIPDTKIAVLLRLHQIQNFARGAQRMGERREKRLRGFPLAPLSRQPHNRAV